MKTQNKVVVMQSNYIPWKGYFDLMADADTFVFYDDVQFTKNDWRNRNKIKNKNGEIWLTVPVGNDIDRNIDEVTISDHTWQKKHWKTLTLNYGKFAGFQSFKPFFEDFYLNQKWGNLSQLNQVLILKIAEILGIRVKILSSKDYNLTGAKQERLISLLQQLNATEYITGPAGMNYLDPAVFRDLKIDLKVKTYGPYPQYQQLTPETNDYVSILDLLFICGNESALFYRSKGTP